MAKRQTSCPTGRPGWGKGPLWFYEQLCTRILHNLIRGGSRGTEGLGHLPQVRPLMFGSTRLRAQRYWFQNSISRPPRLPATL